METFFWGTAAAEYLQPMLLCLFVLRWYVSTLRLDMLNRAGSTWLFVTLAAFFAGLSFENVPAAMLPFMAASLATGGKRLVSRRSLAPVVALAGGWACLMLAPSTAIRRALYASMYHTNGYSVPYLVTRMGSVAHGFFASSWQLVALVLLAAPFAYRERRDGRRLAWLAGLAVLLVGSVVPAPYTESRAFILAWALMFSICVTAIDHAMKAFPLAEACYAWLAAALLAFPVITAVHYTRFGAEARALDGHIRTAKPTSACESGIEVTTKETRYPRRYINNRIAWYRDNPAFVGNYYGCRVVIR